jgi:hypothetical protein
MACCVAEVMERKEREARTDLDLYQEASSPPSQMRGYVNSYVSLNEAQLDEIWFPPGQGICRRCATIAPWTAKIAGPISVASKVPRVCRQVFAQVGLLELILQHPNSYTLHLNLMIRQHR